MKKPLIAVDIDDVLSHTASTILTYGNEKWGYHHTLDDFTEDLATMWQIEKPEAELRWNEFMVSGSFDTFGVIEDAKQALEALQPRFSLWAVTSRRESLLSVTERWLNSNYPGVIEKVLSAGIYGKSRENSVHLTKAEILQEIEADYLIDDQPKHCIGAASVGIPSVMFGEYPWQRDIKLPDLVTRCKSWQEVVRYFDGQ